jgi:hypothetical protein
MAVLLVKGGSCEVNGTTVDIVSGTYDEEVGEVDITDTGSSGEQEIGVGIRRTVIECVGYWDDANKPTSNPPQIIPGTSLTNVKLELANGGSAFTLGTAIVTRVRASLDDIRGAVKYTWTAVKSSTSAPTRP